jgi:ribosomal protein L32E
VVLSVALHPSGLVTVTVYNVDKLGLTLGRAVVALDRAQVGRSQVQA